MAGTLTEIVSAVYEGVNQGEWRVFLSSHHRRGAQARQRAASREGGVAERLKRYREASELGQ